ncbi:aspartyl/glutamyl-tRNA amidotransferase subunit B [Candidatus Mycoplasma haematolamae str. Purdue]|uniref:Aspartyl/glutamyl-tRNA amidotransferase subunit B n=1 Tax=Mycoplasma haematolamae (strain Purdue) TaxID=1212765 RepID=I7C6D4_MYCHA|nr:aspartyl/glutamyl-tRNA amidotransferase subunit B [Candidatus Mycoplasma haematolamae]AFO52062.1 aspartyl/glutamyl-tRNA amidotransferase subunit B [Candidatus Mycoplasma haematolamae str. Purdue]
MELEEKKEVEEGPNYLFRIGLEIHSTIDSKEKAFAKTPIDSNSATSIGFLGTLPQINTHAVRSTIKVAKSLNAVIPNEIYFERKAYFYYDLPRGYQITQHLNPTGRNGYIFLPKMLKKIDITSVVLEEDTASCTQEADRYILSTDRLGAPLIEIVTEPCFRTTDEVIECIKWLRFLLFFLKVSKAELEKGHLRVDLNISLEDEFSRPVTGRAEVKNLASYKAIENAAKAVKDYFLEKMHTDPEAIFENETFSWIDKESRLTVTREKKDSSEYFFVPESSIPVIQAGGEEMRKITKEADSGKLLDLYESIGKSKLASREQDEIISNYEFFWDCYTVYQVLSNWANSFFILKIYNSVGGKTVHLNNLTEFLREITKDLKEEEKATWKFNNWKVRECCKQLTRIEVNIRNTVEFYKSLPTITREDISNYCKSVFDTKKKDLQKFVSRPDKIVDLLLGEVKKRYQGKVEMSEAKEVADEGVSRWIEDFLLEKEGRPEGLNSKEIKEDKN